MKVGFLRRFSAMLVIVLAVSAVYTDQYAQRLAAAEKGKSNTAERQREEAAAEGAGEPIPVREVTQRVLQSQIREAQRPVQDIQKQMREAQWLLEDVQKQKETYTVAELDGGTSLFSNQVDGYAIQIPGGMEADMRYSNIRAVLENESLRIEIYRQEIKDTTGSGINSYINYSNRFIDNDADHDKELEGKLKIRDWTASFLQWSRRALAKVENDKRHYASVEVPLSEREVITFLFKSSQPFVNKSYLDVVRSLTLADKTAQPYVRRIRQTEHPGWDEKTAGVYGKYFGEDAPLRWGIFEAVAPVDFTELKKIEAKLDFTFPILLYYTGILENRDMHPGLAAALANAKQEGRILELTLQTAGQSPEKGNMVYDVLDGAYDPYLKNYAKAVADSGEPVLFRLGNEMNGDWCPYSSHHTSKDTEIFKAFYRYVHQIFQDAGADNVIWVWNPNGRSFPDFKWNDELCYYPGDEYVDVVGMTAYNTGTYYPDETWRSFSELYDPLYERYTALCEKPLMITEFSSSSVGGSKEGWVSDMFRDIVEYKRIKAAVWWDGCDRDAEGNPARPYYIDETEELVRLFRENLAHYK
ncbi:MAG TPA: glycosyl hydrolase [Anaerovoracaceae bacterium]|nr:glycosyl hydrolase [Anaerovoracaceae bacterium]